jgi:hypothetical protein
MDCSRKGEARVYSYFIYEGPPVLDPVPDLRRSDLGIVAMLDAPPRT